METITTSSVLTLLEQRGNSTNSSDRPHTLIELIVYGSITASMSGLTAIGNLLVLLSFGVEKKLRTLSNYFLLSLAVADMTIGLMSIPLYSLTLLMQKWPLPHYVCDLWLSIDYTISNASVANLLVISIDRYLSVTRPLTYRANRTRKRVILMITGSWIISGLVWTPWIYAWPYIEGVRTVPSSECYIQFLSSNAIITVATAVAAFYIPVTVMTLLYARIYYETQRRRQFLTKLQADRPSRHCTCSNQPPTKRSLQFLLSSCLRRNRAQSSRTSAGITSSGKESGDSSGRWNIDSSWIRNQSMQCQYRPISNRNSCRMRKFTGVELPNRTIEENSRFEINVESGTDTIQNCTLSPIGSSSMSWRNSTSSGCVGGDCGGAHVSNQSRESTLVQSGSSAGGTGNSSSNDTGSGVTANLIKKRSSRDQNNERKAAKTLSAILLVFIVTWSPYNLFTVLNALSKKEEPIIKETLYNFGYWLCYLNSTVNPLCYALCNATFRRTFLRLLGCRKLAEQQDPSHATPRDPGSLTGQQIVNVKRPSY